MAELSPTFRSLPTLRLAGIRRWHTLTDAPKTIPDQWHDLHASNLPGLREAKVTYGATAQMDMPSQRLEYLAGYEVQDFNDIPADGRMIVPVARYTVFLLDTVSDPPFQAAIFQGVASLIRLQSWWHARL